MALSNGLMVQVHHSSPLFWGGLDNQRWVYDAVATAGYDLAVITDDAPAWLPALVPPSRTATCNLHSAAERYDAMARLVKGRRLRGIVTYAEEFVIATAELAEKCHVPGVSVSGALCSSSDKVAMKRRLECAGVKSPRFGCARSGDELLQCISVLGCPVVVKPRCGGGSIGVRLIHSVSDAQRVFEDVSRQSRATVDPIFRGFDGTFIVEEYVAGPLVSVDGLVVAGQPLVVGMTDTLMSQEPTFYQLGCWVIDIDEECQILASQAVAALGLDTGAFHCEMRIGSAGPAVIEVAARLPGELIVPMYQDACDIDLLGLFIRASVGETVPNVAARRKSASGAFAAFPATPGRLAAIDGVDTTKRHPCVKRVYVSDRVGESVDLFNPYAVAHICADTSEELQSALSFARNNLAVLVTKEI